MSRYAMCPDCGHRMSRVLNVRGKWEEKAYECNHCSSGFDEEDDESLDVYEAASIWASNGKDENYTFGYSEDELEEAL